MSYVESLIAAGELKLPEGATLAAYEQTVPIEDGFRVYVFMDQLMTRQFGRLLFYARELPSTHTLLSQYAFVNDRFALFVQLIQVLVSLLSNIESRCQIRTYMLFSL